MDTYHVTNTRAVATSAVRAALNRDTFVDRIFLATGIELEVIEGSQETLLTFAAVQRTLGGHPELGTGDVLLFELGGGATEWALMRKGEVIASVTHDFGTVRMRELLRSGESDRRARTRLIQHNVRDMMNAIRRALPFQKITHLIAVGSEARFAARALSRIGATGNGGAAATPDAVTAVAAKDLRKLADQILTMTPDEAASEYSVPANEAESLAPALLAYAELIRLSQVEALLVSRVSMRDGLILQMAQSIREDPPSSSRNRRSRRR
jgi:exopolyphosphatase/guanosine-5'-triphosphate,3'-diphosphate pyrophosphatase